MGATTSTGGAAATAGNGPLGGGPPLHITHTAHPHAVLLVDEALGSRSWAAILLQPSHARDTVGATPGPPPECASGCEPWAHATVTPPLH